VSAPVSARAEIDIAADERKVWTVLADVAAWPTWNPAVRDAVFDGELETGTRFRFSTVFGSMKARLSDVDAPHVLAWRGRLLFMGHRQTWQLQADADGTHVVTDASMSGLGARLFRKRLNQRLQGDLDALVRLLKLEAEARATEEREEEARETSADG
jgi:uncharacterized protein YndB with AHSA1/START domain